MAITIFRSRLVSCEVDVAERSVSDQALDAILLADLQRHHGEEGEEELVGGEE